MMRLSLLGLKVLVFPLANALTLNLPPANTSANNLTLLPSLNITNLGTDQTHHCDPGLEPQPITEESCVDAVYTRLDLRNTTVGTWGPRGQGTFDHVLPQRFISGEFVEELNSRIDMVLITIIKMMDTVLSNHTSHRPHQLTQVMRASHALR